MVMELGKLGNWETGKKSGERLGKTAQVATTFSVLNQIIPQQLSIMQTARAMGNPKPSTKKDLLTHLAKPGQMSLFANRKTRRENCHRNATAIELCKSKK